jgi:hypothetical protein
LDAKCELVKDMTEEERQAILEEAMATVERLQFTEPRHNAPDEDALLRWKRGMPREEPKRERGLDTIQSHDDGQNIDWSGWERWIAAHLRNAMEEQKRFQRALLTELIVRMREEREQDIEKLRASFAEQLNALKAELAQAPRASAWKCNAA